MLSTSVSAFGVLLGLSSEAALAAVPAQAAFSFCAGVPVVATATIGSAGGELRAKVNGGDLTVDVPAGALTSAVPVTICSAVEQSPYPNDPILSFFAIDFPGNATLQTVELTSPLRVTLSGTEFTPHSFIQVQGGGLPRLISNVTTGVGKLTFDAYAIFEYAVYERSPFQSGAKPAAVPAHPHSSSGDRSTIAAALTPFDKAFPLTWNTLWNALITIGVMLLITFPAQLFNKTLDENYSELRTIIGRVVPSGVRTRFSPGGGRSSGAAGFAFVMVAGAVLGGLNDPSFGFNTKSAETLVAVLLAFSAMLTLAGGVDIAYRRRRRLPTAWHLHALPLGLIVAIACMLVSRLTRFEPGYLYGVVAGIAFSEAVGRRERGHGVALGSLATLVLAVCAWMVWSPVRTAASHPHPNFVILISDTLLAGLFVSGVVGTVISLVPLDFMPGSALARWHRGAWTAVFAVALFLLVQVMLRPAARSSRITDAPIVTTLVLFAAFALLSVVFNRYFAARMRRRPSAQEAEDTLVTTPQRFQPGG